MKLVIMVAVACASLALTGCSSTGRFSLIDLDMRSAECIAASTAELCAVVGRPEFIDIDTDEPVATASKTWWSRILDILTPGIGRLRIITVEWNTLDEPETYLDWETL